MKIGLDGCRGSKGDIEMKIHGPDEMSRVPCERLPVKQEGRK